MTSDDRETSLESKVLHSSIFWESSLRHHIASKTRLSEEQLKSSFTQLALQLVGRPLLSCLPAFHGFQKAIWKVGHVACKVCPNWQLFKSVLPVFRAGLKENGDCESDIWERLDECVMTYDVSRLHQRMKQSIKGVSSEATGTNPQTTVGGPDGKELAGAAIHAADGNINDGMSLLSFHRN